MNRYGTQGLLDTSPALAWFIIIFFIAVMVLTIVSMWKVFTKAGKPGWAAIVPIYNLVVLIQIAEKPMWWIAIFLLGGIVPIAGPIAVLVFQVMLFLAIAEKFGKSQGFGVGLFLLGIVFWPILAFGDAQYQGGGAVAGAGSDEILDA